MYRDVGRFNSLVNEINVLIGENDDDWMARKKPKTQIVRDEKERLAVVVANVVDDVEVEGDEEEADDDVMDADEDFNVSKRKKERKIHKDVNKKTFKKNPKTQIVRDEKERLAVVVANVVDDVEVEGDEEEADDDVMDADEDFNVAKRKKQRKIRKDVNKKTFKINEFVKRARAAKIHAYIISQLKKEMPAIMGKSKTQQKLMKNLEDVFAKVQKEFHLPPGDFPDVEHFRQVLGAYNIDKFEKLKPKMIQAVDDMLGYDIPDLLKNFKNPYE
nr:EH domain-containing protein 1-like [Tanacetum cinerariifolium]